MIKALSAANRKSFEQRKQAEVNKETKKEEEEEGAAQLG